MDPPLPSDSAAASTSPQKPPSSPPRPSSQAHVAPSPTAHQNSSGSSNPPPPPPPRPQAWSENRSSSIGDGVAADVDEYHMSTTESPPPSPETTPIVHQKRMSFVPLSLAGPPKPTVPPPPPPVDLSAMYAESVTRRASQAGRSSNAASSAGIAFTSGCTEIDFACSLKNAIGFLTKLTLTLDLDAMVLKQRKAGAKDGQSTGIALDCIVQADVQKGKGEVDVQVRRSSPERQTY